MATLDTGGPKGGRRALDHDIPLIPFIDFLLCLVAFLLVTAVWSQMAQIEATANVPGKQAKPPDQIPKQLHVKVSDRRFELSWHQGSTVLSRISVPRQAVQSAQGVARYPKLAEALEQQWRAHGQHRAPGDRQRDTAVVHISNGEAYGELVAVMDALHAPERPFGSQRGAAFDVAFAMD